MKNNDYIKNIKVLFGTKKGKEVLNNLVDLYISTNQLGETPELTYYKLGQKQLVQDLVDITKLDLDSIMKLNEE